MSKCIHTSSTSAKHVRRGTTRSKIKSRSYLARGAVPLGPRAPRSILPLRPTPVRLRILHLLLLPRVLPVAELLRELRRPGLRLRRPRVPRLRGELRRPGLPLRRPRVPLRRWRCRAERLPALEEALVRTQTGVWRRNLWRSTRWRASTWSWVRTRRVCLHKDQVMELVPADWHHKLMQ